MADKNAHIRGPLDDLSGENGAIEFRGSLRVHDGSGDRYIRLPSGTLSQRPSSPVSGQARYNRTIRDIQWWDGSAWVSPEETSIVTYSSLNANGDVGTSEGQIALGDHSH